MASPHQSNVSDGSFRRHQELMQLYSSTRGRSSSVVSTASSLALPSERGVSQRDLAVLQSKFQFIRDDEADAEEGETDWQVRMSVRYYRQLFREYALADLSRYQEGKIGLRWRTEMEVVSGKGQFSCGNKRCDVRAGLHSYELLFAYVENGEKKRCLVKVRVCGECAEKIFFKKLAEVRKKKEREMKKRERKRRLEGSAKEQKRKRRRRSVPRSDSAGSSDEAEEHGDDESVHELCVKINAQQKKTYPRDVSHANQESSNARSDVFDKLLP
ncbi:hypothetical protein PHYBOEH_004259 [Phytophthora boehmeriae]|uniref:Protein FRA10AC1 n=1 Tax=Phytophthora boehmeriae TaxID=109152 RepID=A0A8T1WM29_9STRA|nr:hypothetical protein PHYBOEH_004259 [Phytophthora boehmeriae]